MRRSIVLAHQKGDQIDDYETLLHCADLLRQEVLCHADDTPMYTTELNPEKGLGEGQSHSCRDWNKLEEWYNDHNACFAYLNQTGGKSDDLERYKYCPKDSSFAPAMRKHFDLPDDWSAEGTDGAAIP
jgi:hypothetical protein